MKFKKFMKDVFTKRIPIKLLAIQLSLRQRKETACRLNLIAENDHRAVVQRRFIDEDPFDELAGNIRVQRDAAGHIFRAENAVR